MRSIALSLSMLSLSMLSFSTLSLSSVASAQPGDELAAYEPRSLDYPDRAAALRPAGLVELSMTWSAGTAYAPGEWEEDLVFQSIDLRVPYESALFEASWTGALEHYDMADGDWMDTSIVYRWGNPRIGASWHEQGDGWRLELGGAFNLPFTHVELLDALHGPFDPGAPSYVGPPPETGGPWRYRGSWNWFQLTAGVLALIPHGRFELDASPEVVLGAELDLPVAIGIDQEHAVFTPQLAIEGALRFLAHAMYGVRAQLVVLPLDLRRYGVAMSLEPFLRVGYADRDFGGFALLAAQIFLGPDYAFARVDPRGSVALKVGGGLLF